MINLTHQEAMFLLILGSLTDTDGRISEAKYNVVARGISVLTPFDDLDPDSTDLKEKICGALNNLAGDQSDQAELLTHAGSLLPDSEDSLLPEFTFALGLYFIFSKIGPKESDRQQASYVSFSCAVTVGALN